MRRKSDRQEELEAITLEERRALVIKAGRVGEPGSASEAYHSPNDSGWGAVREAALEKARHQRA
jgi:hypothetical protein